MKNCQTISKKSYLKRRRIHNFYFCKLLTSWCKPAREFLVSTAKKLLVSTKILTIISIDSWNQRFGYLRYRYSDPQSKEWQMFWDTGTVDPMYPASRAFLSFHLFDLGVETKKGFRSQVCWIDDRFCFVFNQKEKKKKKKQTKECFFFLWS